MHLWPKKIELLHAVLLWTLTAAPSPSLFKVLLVTSSLQNYPKMLEIELSTKRVSWIFNISKIKKPQPLAPYILNDPRKTLQRLVIWLKRPIWVGWFGN